MIVLGYLLVIAVCVAVWAAVSLRRTAPADSATDRRPGHARAPQEADPGDRARPDSNRSDTYDAYRGARARARQAPSAPTPTVAPDRVRPATAVPLFATEREPLPAAPLRAPIPLDAGGAETRTDGIRVTESKRTRERSAQLRAEEPRTDRNEPEDAFERFLRANEDFER